ncbi:MAG: YkgJ family cysteine cluster protein [Nanoarchaeota archaeon]|nr:YkgJ family cysteine cluster protein [Nanoarchaeota archaeon]
MKERPKRLTVDNNTQWECQKCMKCCETNKEIVQKIFNIKSHKEHCHFLEDKTCKIEDNKPLMCRLYPFFPGINDRKFSFAIGKLTIFAGCPGVGKGKKISENKELLKKIDGTAKELMDRFALKLQGKIKDVFEEKKKPAT